MKPNISGKIVGNMIGITDATLYSNGKDSRPPRENGSKNALSAAACAERALAPASSYRAFCAKSIARSSASTDSSILSAIASGTAMSAMLEMTSSSDYKVEIVDCESATNRECTSGSTSHVAKPVCLGGKTFAPNFCRNSPAPK